MRRPLTYKIDGDAIRMDRMQAKMPRVQMATQAGFAAAISAPSAPPTTASRHTWTRPPA